LWISQKRHE
jgi:mannose-6-phosphate isomerase